MRRSVAVFAVVAVIGAAVAAVFGLWLPARTSHRDSAWAAAGQRALALVELPPAYTPVHDTGHIRVCSDSRQAPCLLGPGDPADQLTTLKAALAPLATGTMQSSCIAVPLPNSPPTCTLIVPVSGSRLAVNVFAHPVDRSKPIAQWTYEGAYVEIHVDNR
jgi:hypothetical protein